ncbi:TPA: DUF2913 family protein [Vibrio parahaemolyticus]|uniref:DUF2913 family protein n=1 Tax=Vibrio campbellii TaxID=680 RepID=UPI001F086DEF|nr:DUF2913 family protein [Vibrio campbellii]UMM06809.1 DUF2913 family protein [Vibrio campbellii]
MKIVYNRGEAADKLGHMAWCALVALQMARKYEGLPEKNRVKANKFLGAWAKKALRETRFGIIMNDELEIWVHTGITNAGISNLEKNLEKVYHHYIETSRKVASFPASFKRRILNAAGELRKLEWETKIGFMRDWDNEGEFIPENEHTAIILKEHMDLFDNVGRFDHPIALLVISNDVQTLIDAFYHAGILLYLQGQNTNDGKKQYNFSIWPGNQAPKALKAAKIS